jgi:iron complex transport system substrate-binding protein
VLGAPGFCYPARVRLLCAALCALLLGSTALPGDPREAGDGAPDERAERVVSLNPSLTAILVALGARERLVGVDDFSARDQQAVAELPRVGGLYNPSLEAVVELRPDLVVAVPSAEQRDFRARLRALGIPLLELDPLSFDDVLESVRTLGDRVGRPAAARARVEEILRVRRAVEAAAAERPRLRGVLVLQRDPLFVVGPGSFVDAMLGAVGVENLAAELPGAWPRASREWLIAAAPELLLDASEPAGKAAGTLAFWSRWPSLPAVRAGRVVPLPPGLVALPGPHLDRGLTVLFEAVHGVQAAAALAEAAP